MLERRREPEPRLDLVADWIHTGLRHPFHLGAALAHQVLLLTAGGDYILARAVIEMHMPNESQLLERLQVPIHHGNVRRLN